MEIENILTSEVVDLTSIKSFFATDKDALMQLIEVYINDTSPRLSKLENNVEQVDYEDVRGISHFFKSSFGLMGVKCASDIAELEKLAQNKEDEKVIKDKLNYILPICKNSVVEYSRILDDLRAL